jgi:hypothetical protein
MLVNVGPDASSPSVLLEIPDQDVDPGEVITLRAWANDPTLLTGYHLTAGVVSLGSGRLNRWPGQTTCKYFDFAGDNSPQLFSYPITALSRALAFSPFFGVAANSNAVTTLAAAGADVTDLFARRGHASLVPAAGLPLLYGTVHAVGARGEHCLEWSWTAPSDPAGAQWFWIRKDGELQHKFSLAMSEDPEDTSIAYTDVKIRIIDRRTAGAVLGADVWLNGTYIGKSNDRYGYVRVNRILSGTYPVRVAKSGYTATDADSYTDNDSITIPAAGGEVRVKIGSYA